jgi:hypothetical protein
MQITETMQQPMYVINIPSLLVIGFVIALVLIYYGRGKGKDNPSYYTLMGTGIVLLGVMIMIVPLSWYGSLALIQTSVEMLSSDILILTVLSTIGGIVIGYGLIFIQKRPEVSGW